MKKIYSLLVCVIALCCLLCSCTKQVEKEPITTTAPTTEQVSTTSKTVNYDDVYNATLQQYYQAFSEDWDSIKYEDAGISIGFKSLGNKDAQLKGAGYRIMDLNSDGVMELLVGVTAESFGTNADEIFDIYTVVDGKVTKIFSGWERSRCYLCRDNLLLYIGSSGASNTGEEVLELKNNQLQIKKDESVESCKGKELPLNYTMFSSLK